MILTMAIIDDGLIHKMNKFTWLLEDKELARKIYIYIYIYIYLNILLGKKKQKKSQLPKTNL
jgi:hypothetical protein